MFARPVVDVDGSNQKARPGVGLLANMVSTALAADSNQTLTVAQLSGGLILRSGQTAGRTDTTPTAALILAANPNMDIGDNFIVVISNLAAQILTLAGGTNVTMGTKTTIAASAVGFVMFTKTSSTAMTCTIL